MFPSLNCVWRTSCSYFEKNEDDKMNMRIYIEQRRKELYYYYYIIIINLLTFEIRKFDSWGHRNRVGTPLVTSRIFIIIVGLWDIKLNESWTLYTTDSSYTIWTDFSQPQWPNGFVLNTKLWWLIIIVQHSALNFLVLYIHIHSGAALFPSISLFSIL